MIGPPIPRDLIDRFLKLPIPERGAVVVQIVCPRHRYLVGWLTTDIADKALRRDYPYCNVLKVIGPADWQPPLASWWRRLVNRRHTLRPNVGGEHLTGL